MSDHPTPSRGALHRPRLHLVGAGESCPNAPRVVVAIPVRNEVARIQGCLRALARQEGAAADRVVLLLNGCIDGTRAAIEAIAPSLAVHVEIVERDLRGADATAGMARSLAVAHAAHGLAAHDVLMTTDADGAVAPNWVAANLAALANGADIVCGRAVIDWAEALLIPEHLHADDALECRLGTLIDEIAWLVDPDPHDPWPRHTEHSGASLAFTVAAWRRAGGIPPVPCGEDRAFVDRLHALDARIRHEPEVQVTVSGRIQGRAAGGMADTIRRRMVVQDEFIDSAIEPAADRYRRTSLRAQARALWSGSATNYQPLIEALGVEAAVIGQAFRHRHFGTAWKALERACPVLSPRRVRFSELPAQIAAAEALRDYAAGLHAGAAALPAQVSA
jgi:hypothetical protein